MVKLKECDPVGLVEIAASLGVERKTVSQWHWRSKRGDLPVPMPDPRWTVSGAPAWHWPDIEKWARDTGRGDHLDS